MNQSASSNDNWIDEFFNLFLSEEKGDFGEALDFKNTHIPAKLYRYRPLSNESMKYRFGEIVRGELYMSHPKDLNDPFEICSMLECKDPMNYAEPSMKNQFMESFKASMTPEEYERVFSASNWYEELSLYVAQKTVSSDRVTETKEILAKVFMYGLEMLTGHVNEVRRNILRLASFSETSTNLPMWNHYTNGHQGICLEYNTKDIYHAYYFNSLFPVKYVDRLPDATQMLLRRKYPPWAMQYMAMHKLMDWAYEHEWRLILNVGSWYSDYADVPDSFWENGKLIQFIKPARIIMGTRISDEHEKEMREY